MFLFKNFQGTVVVGLILDWQFPNAGPYFVRLQVASLHSRFFDIYLGGLLESDEVMSLAVAEDLEPLQIISIQGEDVHGRRIVRVVGKFFPAPAIDVERLKVYMLQKLHHELQPGPYVIVYFHTAVQRNDNSPGLWALRDIYETLPNQLKRRLQAVYVVHPGLRSRVVLATLGRFFLNEGFYSKLVYISRLEFLAEYVRKGQVDIPEFVIEHDQELETRPLMDYGLEVDPLQNHDTPLGPAFRGSAWR